MSTENLWGSLDGFKKIKTPLSIVREQGELLTQATQGILEGHVKLESQAATIRFLFFIVAPQLNQYKYQVLVVEHPATIYPVSVYNSVGETPRWEQCPNEAIFLLTIKSILSSSKIKRVIESLLSHSES